MTAPVVRSVWVNGLPRQVTPVDLGDAGHQAEITREVHRLEHPPESPKSSHPA